MKKMISFAAALLLIASGGTALPRGNYSVAYANNDSSYYEYDTSSEWWDSSIIFDDSLRPDSSSAAPVEYHFNREKTAELAEKLTIDMRVCAVLNDGSEIDVKKGGKTTYDELGYYGYSKDKQAELTKEELVKALAASGKTLDDMENFVIYYTVDYSGDDFDSYGAKRFVTGGLYNVELCDTVKAYEMSGGEYQPKITHKDDMILGEHRLNNDIDGNGMWSFYKPIYRYSYETDSYADNSSRILRYEERTPTFDEIASYTFNLYVNFIVPGDDSAPESKHDESTSSKADDSTASKPDDVSSKTDGDSSVPDGKPEVKKGDINGDNTVNVSDIALTAAHVKGIKPLAAEQKKYADLNGDGRIDVSDIVILAKTVKGQK